MKKRDVAEAVREAGAVDGPESEGPASAGRRGVLRRAAYVAPAVMMVKLDRAVAQIGSPPPPPSPFRAP